MKRDRKEVLEILDRAYWILDGQGIKILGDNGEPQTEQMDWAINIVRLAFEELESIENLKEVITDEFRGTITGKAEDC